MRLIRRLAGRRRRRREHDYARVGPSLIIGPALYDWEYRHLAESGVTHVIDLRSERSDDPRLMESLGLAWRRVPMDDEAPPTDAQIDSIAAWLRPREDGSVPTVYLHCQGGLGRSPTVAIALLMRDGLTLAEAYRLVVGARPVAQPTREQEAWLRALE